MSNPLSGTPKQNSADHPAMAHARAWQHVQSMSPETIPEKIQQTDGLLPMFGALAGKSDVTPKDVIKAAADASSRGLASPSEAVKFISSMPTDPDKLQPWIRSIYEAHLSAVVHMKAALMQQAQGAAQPQPTAPQGVMPNG